MKRSLSLLVAIALLLMGYWISRQNSRDVPDDPRVSTEILGGPSGSESSTSEQGVSRTAELRAIIESDNAPIRFFGIVLDDTGSPLPEVEVSWQVLKAGSFAPSIGLPTRASGTLYTDAKGRFSITQSGSSISFDSFKKLGYKEARQMRASYSYGSNAAPHQPDESNPVKFLMVRDNVPPVMKVSIPLKFDWDGRIKEFEIGTRTFSEKIMLIPSIEPEKPGEQDHAWKLVLKVKNGRVILGKQGEAPLAPEAGYIDEVTLQKDLGDQRGTAAEALLYIKTDSGRYAELRITAFSDRGIGSSATAMLALRWNPAGGRSFE